MTKVRVIAAQGATLRGPAVLRLSEGQHSARAHLFGPWKKGAPAKLDGGAEVSFKCGEVFAIEDAEGRLNTALFEDITPVSK